MMECVHVHLDMETTSVRLSQVSIASVHLSSLK